MNSFGSALAGMIGGAALGVAAVFGLAQYGYLPSGAGDAAVHDYMMAHPEILIAMSNKLQMQQQRSDDAAREAAVKKLGIKAFFDPKVAFVTGPKDAKTTFVEFFDYNCPYCRASNPAVEKFYEAHKGKARFAFIEFPIKGPGSTAAARLAIAARRQPDKYLAYHFAMMQEDGMMTAATAVQIARKVGLDLKQLQTDEQDPKISTMIAAAHSLAEAASIDGTPAFIVDGKIKEGALTQSGLKEMAGG